MLYEKYEDQLKVLGLWDDCNRIMKILKYAEFDVSNIDYTRGGGDGYNWYNAVYVDEIQDCTQAEIALFFFAAGMNADSLMMAGDPAQSVVEGVDFRFEFVRSVVYKLTQGRAHINRPVQLDVNFRSHSGILNVAANILDIMFDFFPGSATILSKDV